MHDPLLWSHIVSPGEVFLTETELILLGALTDNFSFYHNISSYDNQSVLNKTLAGLPKVSIQHPALAFVLAIFCVATVFGNILVMAAVAKEQYLHTVTNYFIASLATADCLVGALVMPFSAIHEAMSKHWIFGQDWCDVWHSLDVLASTASILNLCVISLDRYWAITDPISYPRRMTPTKAGLLIAFVWVCSSLISFPAIAWWRGVTTSLPPPYTCDFTDDVGYLVFSSLISFYLPLTVMGYTYYRIYKAARIQARSLRLGTKMIRSCNGDQSSPLTLRIHRGRVFEEETLKAAYPSGSMAPSVEEGDESTAFRTTCRHLKSFSISRKLAKLAKERKAAKTLGIVMGVFILCWLPFFVTNVLMGVCEERCVGHPDLVFSTVTWLGWINSGMNPVIYACWSRDFRRAFNKLLCICCPKYRRRRQRYRTCVERPPQEELQMTNLKCNTDITTS